MCHFYVLVLYIYIYIYIYIHTHKCKYSDMYNHIFFPNKISFELNALFGIKKRNR